LKATRYRRPPTTDGQATQVPLGPRATTSTAPSASSSPAARLGLTQDILQALERLTIPSRRAVLGGIAGRRRSRRYGSSLDLADYRAYTPGDDIRRLDWSAYARLGRLYMRLYAGEEDTCFNLWVDTSASMAWDQATKERPARAIAGAIAFLALASEDRAACIGFSGTVAGRAGPLRGKLNAPRLWAALANLPSGGPTDWDALAAATTALPRGIAVLISDFLAEPRHLRPVLAAQRRAGNDVVLVQVLSPEEFRPTLSGELRLVDSENGGCVDVTLGRAALEAYQAVRGEHARALSALATSFGASLMSVDGSLPLRQILLRDLVRARVASV